MFSLQLIITLTFLLSNAAPLDLDNSMAISMVTAADEPMNDQMKELMKELSGLASRTVSMSERIIRKFMRRSMLMAWSDAVDFLKNFFFRSEQEKDDKDEIEDKQTVSVSDETRVDEKCLLDRDMRSMLNDIISLLMESEHKLKEAKDTNSDQSDQREKTFLDRWRDAVALVKIEVFGGELGEKKGQFNQIEEIIEDGDVDEIYDAFDKLKDAASNYLSQVERVCASCTE